MLDPGFQPRGSVADGLTGSATGTLALPLPAARAVNDLLFLAFSSNGASFGTVPAGWTPVAREVSGAVRGELYWRRADGSEPATVAVTGLGTTARGTVQGYKGGLLAGDPIVAVSTAVEAAGTKGTAPSIASAADYSLILGCVFSEVAEPNTLGFTPVANDVSSDGGLSFVNRAQGSNLSSRLAVFDGLKVVAGTTGPCTNNVVLTGAHVTMLVAVAPQGTIAAGAATRYYLTANHTPMYFEGLPVGNWSSTTEGANSFQPQAARIYVCSTRKAGGSTLFFVRVRRNRKQVGCLFARWMTPPLEAQALNCTLALTACVNGQWVQGLVVGSSVIVYQLHVYVTVGQSTAVRQTLIDNFRDTSGAPWTVTATFRGLSAPRPVVGTVQAGDSIMVELGAYIVSSPNPVPVETFPATDYSTANLLTGTTQSPGLLANPDGVLGDTNTATVSYLEFSQAILEQAPSEPIPPNYVPAAAAVIPSLPYASAVLDNRRAPSNRRALFWKWTADATRRIIVHALGSNHAVALAVMLDPANSTAQSSAVVHSANEPSYAWLAAVVVDVTEGTTYYFRLHEELSTSNLARNSPCFGGAVRIAVVAYVPPQPDDVFMSSSGFLACYREGQLINLSTVLSSLVIDGLAIDYSHLPIPDENDWAILHTGDRLICGVFAADFVSMVDLETLGLGAVGAHDPHELNYILPGTASQPLAGPLSPEGHGVAAVAIRADGRLAVGYFGEGFQDIAAGGNVGATVTAFLDRAADVAPSRAISGAINFLPVDHVGGSPGDPWPAAQVVTPAYEKGGSNYLEYSPDGRILYYASGGNYQPLGARTIKRLDADTGAQLADFATVPIGPGPNPDVRGMAVFRNGGMLVCNGGIVQRLNAAGAVVQTYTPTSPVAPVALFDVSLTKDQTAFWVLDNTAAYLWKLDVSTGAELVFVATYLGSGNAFALEVYAPPLCITAPPLTGCWDPHVGPPAAGCVTPAAGPPGAGCWAPADGEGARVGLIGGDTQP